MRHEEPEEIASNWILEVDCELGQGGPVALRRPAAAAGRGVETTVHPYSLSLSNKTSK